MFSRFFIDRPVFAAVLSIIIVMVGLVTLRSLPVAQYPEIAPPTIMVNASYPGAGARVMANTVAQPIEEQVNGVEGMLYMSSYSTNNGEYALTVTFEVGTDLDMAQVLVQNRVSQAESLLPEAVQRMGLTVEKQSNNILLLIALTSPEKKFDGLYLSNFAGLELRDELARLDGVGSVKVFGATDYSMRIWLDPDRLKARSLTTSDVISAVREQNVQVAAGQLGQPPGKASQPFQYALNVQGRLKDISQFEDIILKGSPGKGMVRLKDVARIELGAKSYNMSCTSMGDESAVIGIFLQPGANALEVGNRVKTRMVELSKRFPDGIVYNIGFDTTDYVEESINEVVETLYIAAVLVVAVILIFLQNWKAAVIPIITIPVSLIGTFGVMAALGVSINMLSLFGIVLAIGIVVDDAIVVVENVMRNINQSGLSPREATIRAMQEVSGPIIATTLVLLAVFIPTAFLGGITGQLYRQFALTIATATLFSSLNALTLSPALSALLLKPSTGRQNIFFRGFNFLFDRVQSIYGKVVGTLIRRAFLMGILFLLITCAAFWKFDQLPKGFVPNEDQGYVMMVVQLPDAASLQRTNEVVSTINRQLAEIPGVDNYDAIPGYSLMDGMTASNAATAFITFDPWEERLPKGLTLDAMMGQLWGVASQIQDAVVLVFPPPPIMGLGTAGGFEMRIQDRGNLGLTTLQKEADGLMMAGNGDGRLQQVFTTFRANIPQLEAKVNRTQVKAYDISVSDVFETLQANMGSYYGNGFNKFGRTYQVRVQADEAFRAHAEDVRRLRVRNGSGGMVPLGAVASVTEILGPQVINRYNMYPAAQIIGQGIPGISSGQAMDLMEKLANETLASGMGFEWTAMSFQEKASKGKSVVIFLLAVMFIYLVLCAQYESWSLPLTVVLTVPLAVLGTVIAVAVRGMDINVYSQIGIVLLIALACKTGILIAEFAKAGRESGQSIEEAAFTAATLRFRPILMTAITFILGVTPLVVATGAGAAGRQALGTAVFSGMISATGLLIFFVPVFYRIIQGFSERLRKKTGIKPEAGLVKSNAET